MATRLRLGPVTGWRPTVLARPSVDDRLAALIAAGPPLERGRHRAAGPLIGLEQEYRVLGPQGQLDFRELIFDLGLGRRFLDPGDAYAHPRPSGAVWTCDEREAEIVLPPVGVEPGFVAEVVDWQAAERQSLRMTLASKAKIDVAFAGESTHLSVQVPDELVVPVARSFAERLSPALMLLTGGVDSWGVWIRERPHRVELCSSHVSGSRLGALAAFAAGAVGALVDGLKVGERLDVRLERAAGKPGWYVDRAAFGGQVYAEGRTTRLALTGGGWVSGGEYLERSWQSARSWLVDSGIGDADLADADSLVSGALALPCELEELAQAAPESVSAEVHGSPYGDVLRSRQRDGFAIGAVMVTWDVVVFVACATDSGQRSFIPVSQRYLATFMRLLGIGALDEVLRDCLRTRFRRRTLRSIDQIHTVAAFNQLGSRDGLLTREIASQ